TQLKNLFATLMPESAKFEDLIGVYDASSRGLRIMSDVVAQKVLCFQSKKGFPDRAKQALKNKSAL
ncbi:MAG: hypothetical protein PHO03_04510, partial [Candidatus Omnitrophica bacterium]|nr:hypothetical protein [Candidatus Omnitrophota bacterium]